METLEKLITLVITLFTLSLISERVINWIKLYFGQAGKKLLCFTGIDEDISKQSDDPRLNAKRDRKILGLNIVVGILVAFLVHANLFDFLRLDNPAKHLGWSDINWPQQPAEWVSFVLYTLIGCTVSGLCMSMGSKFWHDTLDLLFYTKNLRQKLSEKETFTMKSPDQLEEWLGMNKSEILNQVLQKNKQLIESLQYVVGYGIVLDNNGEENIEITSSSEEISHIPSTLPFILPNGHVQNIPIRIRVSTSAKTQAIVHQPATNESLLRNKGTIGLMVRKRNDLDKKCYYLSCYHVLKSYQHDYSRFVANQQEQIIDPEKNGAFVGKLVEGLRTPLVDAAICTIENNVSKIPVIKATSTRLLKEKSDYHKVRFQFWGATSKKTYCYVRSLNYSLSLLYPISATENEFFSLNNLIIVNNADGFSPSKEGDSGAIITDERNCVVGMLVGGDSLQSYVIPINTILDSMDLEIAF